MMEDSVDEMRRRSTSTSTRMMSIKERLGLRGLGCCGATWGFRPTIISVREEDHDHEPQQHENGREGDHRQNPTFQLMMDPIAAGCLPPPTSTGRPSMNLAAALAAERQLREEIGSHESTTPPPLRVSLMRLLEEAAAEGGGGGSGVGDGDAVVVSSNDTVCCVCMVRKKGAAFIPCGHTYCRVCSRELWLNRGSCPLCNRSILEILDIY